jgi:hypothetical protein
MSTNQEQVTTRRANRKCPSATTGRQKQASPLIKLTKLLSKTFRQPLHLPTPDQAAEMKRLCVELDEMMEYRRTHPNWRKEGRWT